MHSTAHASGKAPDTSPPQLSADAKHRIGRRRLPPANTLYRIALWIVGGLTVGFGKYRRRAASIIFWRETRYSFISRRSAEVSLGDGHAPAHAEREACH